MSTERELIDQLRAHGLGIYEAKEIVEGEALAHRLDTLEMAGGRGTWVELDPQSAALRDILGEVVRKLYRKRPPQAA